MNDSGLLVVDLPKARGQDIKDKIARLNPPRPPMPQSPSGLFSLANLQNLSVSDRIAPRSRRQTDSAIAFIRELEPKPKVAALSEAKLPSPGARADNQRRAVRPPGELTIQHRSRPWRVCVVILLGLGVGAATTLWLTRAKPSPPTATKTATATKTVAAPRPPVSTPPVPTPAPAAATSTRDEPSEPATETTPGATASAPDEVRLRKHKRLRRRRRRAGRSGELSRRQLRRVMRRIRYRVKRCFWRRNKRGRAKVELSILGSGEVQSLRVSRTPGKRVKRCVARTVRNRARFPRFRAASMTYAYTYIVR